MQKFKGDFVSITTHEILTRNWLLNLLLIVVEKSLSQAALTKNKYKQIYMNTANSKMFGVLLYENR